MNNEVLIALRDKNRAVVFESPMDTEALEYLKRFQVLDGNEDLDLISTLGECSRGWGPVVIRNAGTLPDTVLDNLAQYMKLTGEGFSGFESSKVVLEGCPGLAFKLVGYAHDLCWRMSVL